MQSKPHVPEDVILTMTELDRDPRVLAAMLGLNRSIRNAALSVQSRLYSPGGFIKAFFPPSCVGHVHGLLNRGSFITGQAVYQYIARNGVWLSNVLILVHEADLGPSALFLAGHGYWQLYAWNGVWDGTDGVDDSEPFRSEPLASVVRLRQGDRTVFLAVPRVSMLHAVLHQRSTLMNALTDDGFFSLYPAATFAEKIAAVTHVPAAGRVLATAQRPFGECRMTGVRHIRPGTLVASTSLGRSPRRFGDSQTWLIPSNNPSPEDHLGQWRMLSANSWSTSSRNFWTQTGTVETETVIWTSILRSPLLTRPQVATAVAKGVIERVLDHIERIAPASQCADKCLKVVMDALWSGGALSVITGGSTYPIAVPSLAWQQSTPDEQDASFVIEL